MSTEKSTSIKSEWTCKLPEEVVSVATSLTTHNTLAATMGNCFLLNEKGEVIGELEVQGQVESVRSSDDGHYFGVYTKEGELLGFDSSGKSQWKIDVEGTDDFDLGCTGKNVALTVPPYAVLVAETADPDTNVDLTFQHKISTLALVENEEDSVIAAGHLGELSRVDLAGENLWQVNAGLENGPMQMSHAAKRVAVSVEDVGFAVYSLEGEEVREFELDGNTTGVAPALGPHGPLFCTLSNENLLQIFDESGNKIFDRSFQTLLIDFDFCDDASLLVAGGDDRNIYGFQMPAGDVTWMISAEKKEQESGKKKSQKKGSKKKNKFRTGVPRPEGAELVGEIELPDAQRPEGLDQIIMTPNGDYAVAVTRKGAIVINREGKKSANVAASEGAYLSHKRNNKKAFLWDENGLATIQLTNGTSDEVSFEEEANLVDCTADGKVYALVNNKQELVIGRADRGEVCRRKITPVPTHLRVSPGGSTILTKDDEGRFRFFDPKGAQQRKQRISGEEDYEQIILEEGFCALGGTQGRVIVHDMSGKVLWTKRVADRIVRMESMGNSISVYSTDGVCMVMNPYGEIEMEFEPPPGLSRLCWPEEEDPMLLHSRRDMLTAYGGYSRKLNARWSYRCEAPVRVFDVDQNGDSVIIAAGNKLYRVEGPDSD